MKIIILSPNASLYVKPEHKKQLEGLSKVLIIDKIQPLSEITELFDNEEKIIWIDPDFCNWSVGKDLINKLQNVRAICLQSISFSRIDTNAATEKGIKIINLRGCFSESVAEWAFLIYMNLLKKIPLLIKSWYIQDYDKFKGYEFFWKTAWIIWMWSIWSRIAEICKGLWMKVIYRSQNSKNDKYNFHEVKDIFQLADAIFPAVADNEDTRKIIKDEYLLSMKPNSYFISIIHQIYNHELLIKMVEEWKIAGYWFESTSSTINDYKWNIWVDPEMAWCTQESVDNSSQQWINNIIKAFNKDYPNIVNN